MRRTSHHHHHHHHPVRHLQRSSEAGLLRPEPPFSPGRGRSHRLLTQPPPGAPGAAATHPPNRAGALRPPPQGREHATQQLLREPAGREERKPRVPPAPPRRGLPALPCPTLPCAAAATTAAACRLGNRGQSPRHTAPPPAAHDPSQPIPDREWPVT